MSVADIGLFVALCQGYVGHCLGLWSTAPPAHAIPPPSDGRLPSCPSPGLCARSTGTPACALRRYGWQDSRAVAQIDPESRS